MPRWWPGHFAVLWAFFRGVLGKVWCGMWFFCGENVVDCVVKVVKFSSLFCDEKKDRDFGFIFRGREVCPRTWTDDTDYEEATARGRVRGMGREADFSTARRTMKL
jgi:hypothetical protein